MLQARCFEGYPSASEGIFDEVKTLRTELAAANERTAVLQSQVDNADINLEQARMSAKAMWRTKLESAESRINELETQTTAAEAVIAKMREVLREALSRLGLTAFPRLAKDITDALAQYPETKEKE